MFKGDNGPHVIVAGLAAPPAPKPTAADPKTPSAQPTEIEPLKSSTAAVRARKKTSNK